MNQFLTQKSPARTALVVLGAVLTLWLLTLAIGEILSYKHLSQDTYPVRTITVNGFAKKSVKPDTAVIYVTTTVEGKTAAEAQTLLDAKANKVDGVVKASGVDTDKDVRVTSYTVTPRYVYPQYPTYGTGVVYADRKLTGFEVSRSLEVKVRKLESVADLVSKLGDAGVTDFQGPNFIVDDMETVQAEARILALADAREQAEKVAKTLGVHLGDVTGYYDNSYPTPYDGYAGSYNVRESAAPKASEFFSGTEDVTSSVGVTFEVR